jgi:exopolysaccharide biosynthesis WecB/TagA/CpsF family protein
VSVELTISSALPYGGRTRDILGVVVTDMSRAEARHTLHQAIVAGRHLKLAFCNAHTVNVATADATFRDALRRFVVLPDGHGVDIASRWLYGRPFSANLNGTDLVPNLLLSAPRPLRVAMIGGRPGVAERAALAIASRDDRHRIGPVLHGFATSDEQAGWLAELAAAPVDIVLVAMGNPRQELWIGDYLSPRHCALAIGVGALFDFLAGEVPRAPQAIRRYRLEWAYRFTQEPQRLFRRYIVGNPVFLLRVFQAKLGFRRS